MIDRERYPEITGILIGLTVIIVVGTKLLMQSAEIQANSEEIKEVGGPAIDPVAAVIILFMVFLIGVVPHAVHRVRQVVANE